VTPEAPDAREARTQALVADLDTRLLPVWMAVWEAGVDDDVIEQLGAAMRVAYIKGYYAALADDRAGCRNALFRTHGYLTD
jgi:hypothetical protein